MTDQGILFNAAGERYIAEAQTASERIHEIWPQVHITIHQHHMDGRPVQMYRMEGMAKTPYERTLSLDTDCWVVDPVPELFEVLDQFDCALPMSGIRTVYPLNVPECFYDFNPGVFAYRWSEQMKGLLADWKKRFLSHFEKLNGVSHPEVGWFHSQPSFSEAIYHSRLRVAPLGQEYNWRGTGYVHKRVKIVHKRPAAEQEAERINRVDDKPRCALLFSEVSVWE
jgi:hypothetical protein